MYDSFHCCQLKKTEHLRLWPERCQGRRTSAFILTLDKAPATSTIGMGTKIRVLF